MSKATRTPTRRKNAMYTASAPSSGGSEDVIDAFYVELDKQFPGDMAIPIPPRAQLRGRQSAMTQAYILADHTMRVIVPIALKCVGDSEGAAKLSKLTPVTNVRTAKTAANTAKSVALAILTTFVTDPKNANASISAMAAFAAVDSLSRTVEGPKPALEFVFATSLGTNVARSVSYASKTDGCTDEVWEAVGNMLAELSSSTPRSIGLPEPVRSNMKSRTRQTRAKTPVRRNGRNLSDKDLRGKDLSGQDLTGVDLRGANLEGANLRGANLMDADLTGADLTDTILLNAHGRMPATKKTNRTKTRRTNAKYTVHGPSSGGSEDILDAFYAELEKQFPGDMAIPIPPREQVRGRESAMTQTFILVDHTVRVIAPIALACVGETVGAAKLRQLTAVTNARTAGVAARATKTVALDAFTAYMINPMAASAAMAVHAAHAAAATSSRMSTGPKPVPEFVFTSAVGVDAARSTAYASRVDGCTDAVWESVRDMLGQLSSSEARS